MNSESKGAFRESIPKNLHVPRANMFVRKSGIIKFQIAFSCHILYDSTGS